VPRSRVFFLVAITSLTLAGLMAPAGQAAGAAPSAVRTTQSVSAVPRPDHVVMLIMENHSAVNILGNPQAPYLNSLAATGASMTQSFAITHPSQPNYIAMFSGSTSGVTDDSCPQNLTGPNLGAELIAAGLGFVTYSEDLPSAGFTGCGAGNYARKHNPGVDFALPASTNQPLTAFPADYSTLPAVSYVVPNLQHDMHDGTIAQADTWVQLTMKPYVAWAAQHNSIMIVTWDEDDNSSNNQIPTIVVGAGIIPGLYPEHINHYDVLRTLQDAYGLAPTGASATATPILDIWSPPTGSPQPVFTSSCVGLTCAVDGTASTGGSGAITGWSWNWGDGSPASAGATASHTYTSAGDFQVALTVSNDAGLAGVAANVVSPRLPGGGGTFASDAFGRTVNSGFGNADIGGPWTLSGAAARFGVSAGLASMTLAAAGTSLAASLTKAVSNDAVLSTSISTDKLADNNGTYVRLIGRHVSTNVEYQATVRIPGTGIPALSVAALEGSATTVTLASAAAGGGIKVTAGSVLNARFQVTGTNPTSLRLKVWPASSPEPANWQITTTNAFAALQAPGSVALGGYLSSASTNAPVVLRFGGVTAQTTLAPPNVAPVAGMTATCVNLTCSVDGTTSADSDGTIASYSWDWGDGAVTGGSLSSHTYAAGGSFPVRLTVTDNLGATGTFLTTLTPAANPDIPPVAILTVSCTDLVCSADGTGSTDPDGTISSYAWTWGDGTTNGSGPSPSHTYAAAGTYQVTLTVTDNQGGTNSGSSSVSPSMAPNVNPNAALGVTCANLVCSADSAGSSDPDGAITDYSWNWGDGSALTDGPTSTHTYAAAGSFTVTLTVTDNRGGTSNASQTATPTAAPVNPPFAIDTFARTVVGGWGPADLGGSWAIAGGASNFAVSGGRGLMTFSKPGTTMSGYLPGSVSSSTDFTVSVSTDKRADNNGLYYTFAGRHVGTNLEYASHARVTGTGAVVLNLGALTGTATSVNLTPQIVVPGLVIPPGGSMNSRVQVFGTNPTTIRAKVWATTGSEPAAWQLTATNSTAALQSRGSIGILLYLSSGSTNAPITARVTNLSAQPATP
jgi:PKD repeat protein